MKEDLEKLRRDVRGLKALAGLSGVVILALSLVAWGPFQPGGEVPRARGLVIEDARGRARILLGAPVPEVPGRVRTDTARVREAWAHRFPDPDEFMRSYRERVRHSMNGLLILNEEGFDRLAVGAPYPDPWFGPRLGPATGLVVDDERGGERTGYGLLDVEGRKRLVLGLDRAFRGLLARDGDTTVARVDAGGGG